MSPHIYLTVREWIEASAMLARRAVEREGGREGKLERGERPEMDTKYTVHRIAVYEAKQKGVSRSRFAFLSLLVFSFSIPFPFSF